MTKKLNILYGILLFIIIARIFTMVTFPLTDTTEARYAHVAYLMASTNDWITPYYDIGIPFWGKPPFSFWAEAISYKIFGMHDFSARVPAFIFTLLTMGLIFKYLKTFYNQRAGLWGAIIYLSFLLTYGLSGAVLTDPYLTFATTLSMVSFIMVIRDQKSYWKYLFFLGISIGLIAKGPLAPVLIAGAIILWVIFDFKRRFKELGKLPWLKGTLLTIMLSVPWYIIAELKTPGFLDYFIVGEHFKRFVDPGWAGDLYGSSHKKPHGMIWLMWLESAFPWVFVALYIIFKNLRSKSKILNTFTILKQDSEISYFIAWSIFTMVFFTLAGNILWTYILPALPALALLLAIYFDKMGYKIEFKTYNILYLSALFVPVVVTLLNFYTIEHREKLKTEKYLVEYYKSVSEANDNIYYLDSRPFSAQYYSNDKAVLVLIYSKGEKKHSKTMKLELFKEKLEQSTHKSFIAIPKKRVESLQSQINKPMKKIFENRRYMLFEVEA